MKTVLTDVRAGELLQDGPPIVVIAVDAGSGPADRYKLGAAAAASQKVGTPLVAILRSGLLATPDRFHVTESTIDGKSFRLVLDVRRYTGPKTTNDGRETLVQADLGSLSKGHYRVFVTRTTRDFQDPHRPERADNPVKTEDRLEFDVL